MATYALEFLILTVMRANAVLGAQFDEIDFDNKVWTVPAARMKKRTEPFRVPLSSAAMAIVEKMLAIRKNELVFPSPFPSRSRNGGIHINMLVRLIERLGDWRDEKGRRITAHGFRATFGGWADEVGGYPDNLIEMALGHKIASKTKRPYRREDMLERRRLMLQAFAHYCDGVTVTADVIPLRAGGSVIDRAQATKNCASDASI
jgi:integrase